MEKTIEGKIISKELSEFGHNRTLYGYLGIEKPNGEQIMVKVDTFTWYETLEIGADVFVETEKLGTTGIIIARRIDVNLDPLPAKNHEITANV